MLACDRHVRPVNFAYILEPGELVGLGIGSDDALEVDVVALLDDVGIQGDAHPKAHHRLILHVQMPFILERAVGNIRILGPAREVFAVVVDAWHEAEDAQALIVLRRILHCGNRQTERKREKEKKNY